MLNKIKMTEFWYLFINIHTEYSREHIPCIPTCLVSLSFTFLFTVSAAETDMHWDSLERGISVKILPASISAKFYTKDALPLEFLSFRNPIFKEFNYNVAS